MTSEPQAGHRDDDAREHRTIGQRIRDAVLGEPGDTGHDAPAAGGYADTERRDVDRDDLDAGVADRGDRAGYAEADRGDPGVARAEAGRGDVDRGDLDRDASAASGTDREYTGYEEAMREHVAGGAVPDPVRDVGQGGMRGDVDRDTVAGQGPSGGIRDDRDMVTGSYDPDRDAGYDPQAAGTAMGSATTGAGAGRATEPTDVRDRDVEGRDLRDRRAPDRGTAAYDDRDYDPAADTAYVDEGRAETERGTGHRDADYDTGRVDAGRARDDRGTAGLGSAGAGAGVAAAGAAAAHHREGGREGFSQVDDTSTVDPSPSGMATADRSGDSPAASRAEVVAADDAESGGRERLIPADRAHDYSSRWDALKGDFVDEPRRAVARADELVGELLDEIQRLFTDQRRELEQGFDHDRASTEDLRLALRRYRSFFDRLLSF